MAEPRAAQSREVIPANEYIIGSKVVNPQNENIGKIEDLVIDANAGRGQLIGKRLGHRGDACQ